jgi:hypothetical protein
MCCLSAAFMQFTIKRTKYRSVFFRSPPNSIIANRNNRPSKPECHCDSQDYSWAAGREFAPVLNFSKAQLTGIGII